jgi:adenylate cyclase
MNLGNIVVITAVFILFNLYIAYYNIAMINSPFSSGPSDIFDSHLHLIMNALSGLVTGVLTGVIGTVVNRKLFRRKSFMFGMLITVVAYVFFFVLVTVIVTSVSVSKDLGDRAVYI